MISYKVINWDFNSDNIVHYDIMPYLYDCLEKTVIDKKDITLSWLKQFIVDCSMYQYWSRCEYETIITGWPKGKKEYKLDVYEQIKMNLDNIALLMYNDLMNENNE